MQLNLQPWVHAGTDFVQFFYWGGKYFETSNYSGHWLLQFTTAKVVPKKVITSIYAEKKKL